MKILFVIDTFYTSNNGTSISAQRFAKELRARGHEVRVLCGDKEGTKDKVQGTKEVLTDGDYCTGIFHFPVFQFLCEKHDFFYGNADKELIREACDWADIVHIYTPFFMSNAAITYCKQVGKPVTAAFHIQPENITSSFALGKVKWINAMIYRIFRRVTYNRVRHVHTPSFFIANQLRNNGYTSQLHIISNGIHDEFIEVFGSKSATESPKSVFKIMMIGRLSREKRQDVIIKAMKYSKHADRIQLVFAGKGPEYNNYVRLSKNLNHPPRFVYLNRQQLIHELQTTDLYIHASDMEAEAISCIEAFATGIVPVISNSRDSATSQFALDERSLFQAGDAKDLARVIDYWLDRPHERQIMGERYAHAARKYSLTNSVILFENMLRDEIRDNQKYGQATRLPSTSHIAMLSSIKRQVLRLYRRIA